MYGMQRMLFLSPPSRVIWTLDHMKVMHSSSADQSNLGVDVSIHVELNAIWPAAICLKRSSSELLECFSKSLILRQAWSAGVVWPWLYKYIVCDCWLLFVLDLIECVGCSSTFKPVMLKHETRALFVLQSLERQRYSIFGVTQTDVSASNYIVPFDD